MKKLFLLALLIFSGLFLNAQDLGYPRIGVGLQGNAPIRGSNGLSAKLDITNRHSAQIVFDIVGRFTSYAFRYLYNFNEGGNDFKYKPYLLGQIGIFNYHYMPAPPLLNRTQSVFGLGFGGGLEVHYIPFTDRVRLNIELGYGSVDFDFYDDYQTVFFGLGLHYYFNI